MKCSHTIQPANVTEGLPPTVVVSLKYSIGILTAMQKALEDGRRCDLMYKGNGRYESDAVVNLHNTPQVFNAKKEAAYAQIERIRAIASQNCPFLDFSAAITELGGVPSVELVEISQAALAWFN